MTFPESGPGVMALRNRLGMKALMIRRVAALPASQQRTGGPFEDDPTAWEGRRGGTDELLGRGTLLRGDAEAAAVGCSTWLARATLNAPFYPPPLRRSQMADTVFQLRVVADTPRFFSTTSLG